MNAAQVHPRGPQLSRGVAEVCTLPSEGDGGWSHLYLPPGVKERLFNQAVFSLAHRERLHPVRVGLHGLVVLSGPPGTGKTTTARALAQVVARQLVDQGETTLVVLDPHDLPSDLLGESQRNVARLLDRVLPELAATRRFTFVLVDEVEALAVRRDLASFDSNPADLHRATDAVLAGFDALAAGHPRLLVVATTNFASAVDQALLSRADLIVPFPLPDEKTAVAILRDTLEELAGTWPALDALAGHEEGLRVVAARCAGLDGRRLRKLVLAACTLRTETALDPGLLTLEDLLAATAAP